MEKLNRLMDLYFVGMTAMPECDLDVLRIIANDTEFNPSSCHELINYMGNVEIVGYVGCEYEIMSRYLRDEGADHITSLSMMEYTVDLLNKQQRTALILDCIDDDIQVYDVRIYYRIY